MGPKKSQAKTNAFACYVNEYRGNHKFMSFEEAASKITPIWKNMSKKDREKYEEMAKISNGTRQKLTTTGVAIEEVEKKLREEQEDENRKKQETEVLVRDAIREGNIKEKYFYVMHMHFHCFRNDEYYPAEVSLCKFNLLNGIQALYHEIIYPGKLPLGSSNDAKMHSTETHALNIPLSSEDNMEEVVGKLVQFLTLDNVDFPPVFAREEGFKEKNIDVIENVFNGKFRGLKVRVLPVECLLFQLKKQLEGPQAIPVYSLATAEFNKDQYEFTSDLNCDTHENTQVPYRCSRSIVARFVFIICDNVCRSLNIRLIPGKHVPRGTFVHNQESASNAAIGYKLNTSDECSSKDMRFINDTDTETVLDYDESRRTRTSRPTYEPSECSEDYQLSFQTTTEGSLSQNTDDMKYKIVPSRRPKKKPVASSDVDAMSLSSLSMENSQESSFDSRPSVGGAIPRIGKGRGRRLQQFKN